MANRRRFDEALQAEWKRTARERSSLGLLLVDIDHFKLYNDALGHPAGDECLQIVAAAVARAVKRPGDLAARYGGEEFAVILPNTEAPGAAHAGEQVAEAVRALRIPHPAGADMIVTVSVGAASAAFSAQDVTVPPNFVRDADQALYEAKRAGRNTVRLAAALVRA